MLQVGSQVRRNPLPVAASAEVSTSPTNPRNQLSTPEQKCAYISRDIVYAAFDIKERLDEPDRDRPRRRSARRRCPGAWHPDEEGDGQHGAAGGAGEPAPRDGADPAARGGRRRRLPPGTAGRQAELPPGTGAQFLIDTSALARLMRPDAESFGWDQAVAPAHIPLSPVPAPGSPSHPTPTP